MLKSFVSCIDSKDIFGSFPKGKQVRLEGRFLFTTIVDDDNMQQASGRQCPSKSRALSEGEDYLHSLLLTKCQHSALLLRVAASKILDQQSY